MDTMFLLEILFAMVPLAILVLFLSASKITRYISKGSAFLKSLIKGVFSGITEGKIEKNDALDITIKAAGYSYDPLQDMFYSNLDAWQRDFGYCRLYDEAAAPFGMIIDCEPVEFEYQGKKWLIEFWKGQYDMTTGCEIGIYKELRSDLDIPDIFKGIFYECVSDEEQIYMECSLKKNDKVLFERKEKHWWLTGFKLGEFSEPSELSMDITVTLKDVEMCNEFIKGLKNIKYTEGEIIREGDSTIKLKFANPRTPQPITRTKESDRLIQRKNQILCEKYKEITGLCKDINEKLKAVKDKSPELYNLMLNPGKAEQVFAVYKKISNYLRDD